MIRIPVHGKGLSMNRMFAALGAALITLLGASWLSAHEGHDHDAAPLPASVSIAPRAEATSDAFELIAIAQGSELAIYLDRFPTNEPVEGAAIEVETPNGPVMAGVHGDSYEIPATWLSKPGRYDLIFTVTAKEGADVLPLTVEIPEARSEPTPPGDRAAHGERWSGQALLILGVAAGFVIGMTWMAFFRRGRTVATSVLFLAAATVFGANGFTHEALAHEGEDHGSSSEAPRFASRDLAQLLPDGSVFVPKATQRILAIRTVLTEQGHFRRAIELPGRIIPDPNASGYVQASVGGRISPPPGGFPKLGTRVSQGEVLAFVTPPIQAIDVSDMRQRQGELDQQISIVERRVVRYEPLVQSGAITRVQLDEARLELQGLKDRRAALDKARREPEALIAPVSGIVADGVVAAGQIVQPNTVAFQIVDPERLWIEALSFNALSGTQTATARSPSGRSLALKYQGSGFTDRNQSIPIHFAIEGDVTGLRVGQFVTVLANTDEERNGLAVPRGSVVRSANGQDVVYEHVTAERFQARLVRIEPLDGERVLIATGIGPGRRVVTQGAELLDQVR
jgi:membrane fusion protein, heavy metal efflux system